MRVLLVLILILITSCSIPRAVKGYSYEKNGYKVLYSDTIEYDCGKKQVVHYYKE